MGHPRHAKARQQNRLKKNKIAWLSPSFQHWPVFSHGSWLNLIENQFSKMTRTMLRGIRVASKQELIDRIHQYFEEINADPVVFRWKYKMDETLIV